MSDLLPCPFCGRNDASLSTGADHAGKPFYYVECGDCGAAGPPDTAPEWPLEAWNERNRPVDCCEHGVTAGDYCEVCHKDYKEARIENGDADG